MLWRFLRETTGIPGIFGRGIFFLMREPSWEEVEAVVWRMKRSFRVDGDVDGKAAQGINRR